MHGTPDFLISWYSEHLSSSVMMECNRNNILVLVSTVIAITICC